MRHRFSLLLLLAAAFIFLTGTLFFSPLPTYGRQLLVPESHEVHEEPAPHSVNLPPPTKTLIPEASENNNANNLLTHNLLQRPVKVTITETGGSHDEVVAALVHSFGSISQVSIDLYQLLPRYGIKDIMKAFSLANPLQGPRGPGELKGRVDKNRPDVFVAGTCELDIKATGNGVKDTLDKLLEDGGTFLICVVHHADRWGMPDHKLEEHIKPWVDAGRVEFWTLSPHTAKFLVEQSISKWAPTKEAPVVKYFVPVFPVQLPKTPSGAGAEREDMGFAMQGDYDPARRDYKSIFAQLSRFKAEGATDEARNVSMRLLGHGPHPQVPEDIKDAVFFDENLKYGDFYAILSKTFALVPGFASKEYYDRKASSSVPAALIAGTPLVAKQELLDAYGYITKDVVWLQGEEEADLDVVGRVIGMSADERRGKKGAVRKRCGEIIERNREWVEDRIVGALEKMGKENKKE